jgi:hypothetical protein
MSIIEANEYHGISVEAFLKREDQRWTIWILGGPWIDADLKAELNDGMAFVIDKKDDRTNGIYLKQVSYGNTEDG